MDKEEITPDTDQEDNFEVGQGEAPVETDEKVSAIDGEPIDDKLEKAPEEEVSVVDEVSKELSGEGQEEEGDGVAKAKAPNSFDISQLTREQIQQLKQVLNATPDTIERKKSNPKVTLRQIDGRYVVDWKNSYLGLVRDPENNRDVERHIIPVLYKDAKEYENVLLSKFINSDRVPCEVVDIHQKREEVVEGETISRETGLPVEMVVVKIETEFSIKLPEGEIVRIKSKMANA